MLYIGYSYINGWAGEEIAEIAQFESIEYDNYTRCGLITLCGGNMESLLLPMTTDEYKEFMKKLEAVLKDSSKRFFKLNKPILFDTEDADQNEQLAEIESLVKYWEDNKMDEKFNVVTW